LAYWVVSHVPFRRSPIAQTVNPIQHSFMVDPRIVSTDVNV